MVTGPHFTGCKGTPGARDLETIALIGMALGKFDAVPTVNYSSDRGLLPSGSQTKEKNHSANELIIIRGTE